jgi:hypothetical protein
MLKLSKMINLKLKEKRKELMMVKETKKKYDI